MDTNTFIVKRDASEYEITEVNFAASMLNNLMGRRFENWPVLYLLTNSDKKKPKAYIGQTTSAQRRMRQHLASKKKDIFEDAHIIYSEEFNQSVTFDYESRLIELFSAEGTYELTNGNGGLSNKDYFDRERYLKLFDRLWETLYEQKLVTKTLTEIRNSDLFKYSPYKSLNADQEMAAVEILNAIRHDKDMPIIVKGMPGSGKTIVAIYMMKRLRDNPHLKDKKIALVIPQASLRRTLQRLFKQIYNLRAADVIGPSGVVKVDGMYDIVFVDEAHRLKQPKNIVNWNSHYGNNEKLGLGRTEGTELDWILKKVKCPVFLYDANQVIGPSGTNYQLFKEKVEEALKDRGGNLFVEPVKEIELKTQMRSAGGKRYIDYIEDILFEKNPPVINFNKHVGDAGYEFKIIEDFKTFRNLMYEKEKAYGLSRMMAGYAWKWISKKDKDLYDIEIDGIYIRWNVEANDWVNSEGAIDQMGSIHTLQGYDLNYGFVVLGPDIRYDKEQEKIVVNRKSYFDINGRKGVETDEELLKYVKNIYYVLMSRGIRGTYLYICDEALREYFKQYVEVM